VGDQAGYADKASPGGQLVGGSAICIATAAAGASRRRLPEHRWVEQQSIHLIRCWQLHCRVEVGQVEHAEHHSTGKVSN
jgi:hypothetical protein